MGEIIVSIDEESWNKSTKKILSELANFILTKSAENIEANKSRDTSYLIGSGRVELEPDVKVGYTAEHALPTEYGRRKGARMPPVENIAKWVRRKKAEAKGKREKKLMRIAWRVARGIVKYGIKPKPFFRPAIEECRRKYSE